MIKFATGQIVYIRKVGHQTIIRFYQVVRSTSNTCELRELRKKIYTQNFDEQEVGPIPDDFTSNPFRKKITKTGAIMMDENLYAWPWDGDTVWQTIIIFMP